MGTLIFVDCEATGPCPSLGKLTEFGAAVSPSKSRIIFHGILAETSPSTENPAIPVITGKIFEEKEIFERFEKWLIKVTNGEKPIFISDNPGYDWQWIHDGFCRNLNRNPFGYSSRRIGDYYAGLIKNFHDSSSWKKLRVTPHTHNPVDDALGNLEAFEAIEKMYNK